MIKFGGALVEGSGGSVTVRGSVFFGVIKDSQGLILLRFYLAL